MGHMSLSAESMGRGKPELPPEAKQPVTEEAVTARALEVMKKMNFPVSSPDFEKAFVADFIKRIEAGGQVVIRAGKQGEGSSGHA